nr:50S ribosomal protein L10 [Hyphobacterium sp. CCMP332]
MDRLTKEASVEELKGIFSSGSVVIAHYSGMTVAEMTDLRTKLRETGGTFKVVRNRLAKIALQGNSAEAASEYFNGPVGIAFSEDFTAAPKAAVPMPRITRSSKFSAVSWKQKSLTPMALRLCRKCRRVKNLSEWLRPVFWVRLAKLSRVSPLGPDTGRTDTGYRRKAEA